MLDRLSLRGLIAGCVALLVPLFAIGWLTREDPADKPLLQISGGGFIFNYRVAEVYYGFSASVMRPLPVGSIIEAEFEDPAGGEAHRARLRVGADTRHYSLRSPPVRGVEAGRPYHVAIKVFDREEKELIWQQELDIRSQISDAIVPDQPLTIGPGYAKNPQAGG